MKKSKAVEIDENGRVIINIASSNSNEDWLRARRKAIIGDKVDEEKTFIVDKKNTIDL